VAEPGGEVIELDLDPSTGAFSAEIPEGRYTARWGSASADVTILPGSVVDLDLTRPIDLAVSADVLAEGRLRIRVEAKGAGPHSIELRPANLDLDGPLTRKVELEAGKPQALVWEGRVVSPKSPWLTLVIPDERLDLLKELYRASP
jgi:hypothetical protein